MELCDEIVSMAETGLTSKEISGTLQSRFPGRRGLSVPTVKKVLQARGFKRQHFADQETVNALVASATAEVGYQYGYRFMKGYLESQLGRAPCEKRIRRAMQLTDPQHHRQRTHEQTPDNLVCMQRGGHIPTLSGTLRVRTSTRPLSLAEFGVRTSTR